MWAGLGLAISMVVVSPCTAQVIDEGNGNHVSLYKFGQSGWTFHVIYARTGQNVVATDVLALSVPEATVGENLQAVWYTRAGGSWTAVSWNAANRYDAVKHVSMQRSIPESSYWRWNIDGASIAAASGTVSPSAYDGGLLAGDSFAPVVNASPDRDAIIALLADAGYTAANVPAEKIGEGQCGVDAVLNSMGIATEVAVMMPAEPVSSMAATYAEVMLTECEGTPGEKGNVAVIDWTEPATEPSGPPSSPPELTGCPDGMQPAKCLWKVPGKYKQRKYCLKFLPPGQQGPPYTVCEQERDLGQCTPYFICDPGVNPPTSPPCQIFSPLCDETPGPWRTVSGDCADCPYDGL